MLPARFKWLKGVTRDDKRLHWVRRGYKGLQGLEQVT